MEAKRFLASIAEFAEALGLLAAASADNARPVGPRGVSSPAHVETNSVIRRIALPGGDVAFQACWRRNGRLSVETFKTEGAAAQALARSARSAQLSESETRKRGRVVIRDVRVEPLEDAAVAEVVELVAGLLRPEAFEAMTGNPRMEEPDDEDKTEAA